MKPSQYLLAAHLARSQGVNNSFFRQVGDLFGASGASPAGAQNAGELILAVLQVLLIVAASIAVIFLIIGGYRYVVSRGNEEGMEGAKKTITSSILGLVIIILAFAIVRIISAILLQAPGPGTGIQ